MITTKTSDTLQHVWYMYMLTLQVELEQYYKLFRGLPQPIRKKRMNAAHRFATQSKREMSRASQKSQAKAAVKKYCKIPATAMQLTCK